MENKNGNFLLIFYSMKECLKKNPELIYDWSAYSKELEAVIARKKATFKKKTPKKKRRLSSNAYYI